MNTTPKDTAAGFLILAAVLTPIFGVMLYFYYIMSVAFGGPTTVGQLVSRDDGTVKWSEFYSLNVELEHLGKPLKLDVVISCGSQARQIVGEGRSARGIYAPYIFGLADGPHGILVLSPYLCNRDFTKHPIPSDYQPVMFWAPDAKNLEFMIAYLHEKAFDGPSSKLKFLGASVREATNQEYDEWRRTTWPKNIVPLADDDLSWRNNSNYFSGASRQSKRTAKATWFPSSDLRDYGPDLECHSMVRLRADAELSAFLRAHRPAEAPQFWSLPVAARQAFYAERMRGIPYFTVPDDGLSQMEPITLPEPAAGVAKVGGHGTAGMRDKLDRLGGAAFGLVRRAPVYTNTAYPAIAAAGSIPRHRDIMMGPLADVGTAYCYREVGVAIFARMTRQSRGVWEGPRQLTPHRLRAFVDGTQISDREQQQLSDGESMVIAETDEFIWVRSTMQLKSEWARNQ